MLYAGSGAGQEWLMMDETLSWRIERVCQRAWPALEEERLGDWCLRFAGGYTGRANSANPLSAAPGGIERAIATSQSRYRARGLPSIFRIPSFLDPAVDVGLAANGYTSEAESIVLFGADDGWRLQGGDADVELTNDPMPYWLASAAHLRAQGPDVTPHFARIIAALDRPVAFASLRQRGAVVATGFAVVAEGLTCLEAIVTDPAWRGRGFGRRLVMELLAWGARLGATGACLQVEADNAPARAVYARVGFGQEIYRYHYRREPAG